MANIDNQYKQLVSTIGQAAISALYPNDFEYYAFALELVNSKKQTEAYLVFPLMPDSITINDNKLTNIIKTQGGVLSLSNPSFSVKNYTISGTFGRNFKLLTQKNAVSSAVVGAFASQTASLTFIQGLKNVFGKSESLSFSDIIKTGYGVMKLLEYMLIQSDRLDADGNPYYLFMYNLSFNHNYLVKATNISFSQERGSNNGFWRYNLSLSCIANAKDVKISQGFDNTVTSNSIIKNIASSQTARLLAGNTSNFLNNAVVSVQKNIGVI